MSLATANGCNPKSYCATGQANDSLSLCMRLMTPSIATAEQRYLRMALRSQIELDKFEAVQVSRRNGGAASIRKIGHRPLSGNSPSHISGRLFVGRSLSDNQYIEEEQRVLSARIYWHRDGEIIRVSGRRKFHARSGKRRVRAPSGLLPVTAERYPPIPGGKRTNTEHVSELACGSGRASTRSREN